MNRLIGHQLSLFGGAPAEVWSSGKPPARAKTPKARKSDPETSKAAASEAAELASRHRDIIVQSLRAARGSKDQIAARVHLTGVQVGRRLKELRDLGLAWPTSETVLSASGRKERVWEAAS